MRSLVLESATAGFYVNITRSLAPIYLAVLGYGILDVVRLNAQAYLFATITSYIVYRFRHELLKNPKRYLITFHALERVFWGIIPLSNALLPAVYTLAICFTVPTSSLMNVAIFSLDEKTAKRTLALRNSFGAFSNVLGSLTTLITMYALKSVVKYVYLYALASSVGFVSTAVLLFTEVEGVKLGDVEEELKVRYVNVLLFLLLVTSSSAIIGSTWTPHLLRDLKVEDYFAVAISFVQTITSVFSPLFWSGRSYRSYRTAVLMASMIPILIYSIRIPQLHILVAVLYAFSFNGTNMLSSFVCAEIKGKDVPFLYTSVTTTSQLLGTLLATLLVKFELMMLASATLLISALAISLLTIPEISVDVERARIYSRIVYNVTLSGYSFSTTLAKETTLLTLRLTAIAVSILLIIFIYRVAYYLSL